MTHGKQAEATKYVVRFYGEDPEGPGETLGVVGPFGTPQEAAKALEAAGRRPWGGSADDPLEISWRPGWAEIVPLLDSMPQG
jgi:hypothetical protein